MNNEQFQSFLDRHGTDLGRWTEAERAAAERLVASDRQARQAFEAARRLDAALTRHLQAQATDAAAAARVLTQLGGELPRQKVPLWRLPAVLLNWQFAPAWPRMAALGACAVIGFAIGITGLDRRIDRLDGQSAAASSAGIGPLVFEPEELTGARP
jgi:anti-sigma-K factor RskA